MIKPGWDMSLKSPQTHIAIGIDIGGTKIAAVVVDIDDDSDYGSNDVVDNDGSGDVVDDVVVDDGSNDVAANDGDGSATTPSTTPPTTAATTAATTTATPTTGSTRPALRTTTLLPRCRLTKIFNFIFFLKEHCPL